MSTLKVNSIEPTNAGSEDFFLVRAWASVNQTGVQSINADGNVSSITDNGLGDTTFNFTTNMVDGNYAFASGAAGSTHTELEFPTGEVNTAQTSSVCRMRMLRAGVSSSDHSQFTLTVTR